MDTLKSFEQKMKAMNSNELLNTTEQLFNREKKISDAILVCLQVIQDRKLFSECGYGSLFDMLVKKYGCSESSAFQRIGCLKMIKAVPEAQKSLQAGEVSVSTLAFANSFIKKTSKSVAKPIRPQKKKKFSR